LKFDAMQITIKEIGLATCMTSVTTAIGFSSLYLSKLKTIQDFGLNAAVGVMIAYITVIFFTTSMLSLFDKDKIIRMDHHLSRWTPFLDKIYSINRHHQKRIFLCSIVLTLLFVIGIFQISTNYNIEDNLPRGAKVTQDFKYFEKNYAGFRPLEFAITAKKGNKADEYLILKEVDKLDHHIKSTGVIKSSLSMATLYRSIHKMNHGNSVSSYQFPDTEDEFDSYAKMVDRAVGDEASILLNKDRTKTRISARITDIGADKIKEFGTQLDQWINTNIDTSVMSVKRTGSGLILDKNSEYVTASLLQGLGLSVIIISFLMGFLFKSWRMTIIAFLPNLIPLLFAAAMLGYFSIDLEAGVSIMFAIIFGIAVDDSIHFLGRYKLCISEGLSTDAAVKKSISESGKAIIITTIILFFGFFNMIFSVNPPTFTVGILISVTLLSALICDLLLLPALILRFMK
ncbi:MAG: MMPL family transporter, partial [Saprospiraceae bacterium]